MQPRLFAGASDAVSGGNSLLLDAFVSRGSVVGESCVLDSKSVVSRDARIGDRALVSVGAVVGEGVSVGPRAVVATGAVALEDVPGGATVVGNPARMVGAG